MGFKEVTMGDADHDGSPKSGAAVRSGGDLPGSAHKRPLNVNRVKAHW
jgi:hypothetical protein